MRISYWSSDVCSSDLLGGSLNFYLNYYWTDNYIVGLARFDSYNLLNGHIAINNIMDSGLDVQIFGQNLTDKTYFLNPNASGSSPGFITKSLGAPRTYGIRIRSEEHTSELQSLMRISYAVFCLKKKKQNTNYQTRT